MGGLVPFSADNPNRNRNYVILVLALVVAFALVMAAYVALALHGDDTDAFIRFLTIVFVTLIPSGLAAVRANSAATHSEEAVRKVNVVADRVSDVKETLNGTLDARMRQANRDTAEEENTNGRPSV